MRDEHKAMDEHEISILHIASGDLWAGAEVQLFTLVSQLNTFHNTTIHVVLLNHGTLEQQLLDNNIAVTVLDESRLNGFHILMKLINIVASIKPDVIHTHRIKENISGSIAALLNGNIPSLRTAHGAPEHNPAWLQIPKHLILFLDWFCARFLQKQIVAVSQDLADILQQSYPKQKISVIENGIVIDDFSHKKTEISTADTESSPLEVAIAGRLTPIKRIDIFFQTAQFLKQNHPEMNLSFHIYGDGPLRDELDLLSKELMVDDIVHFEGHSSDIKSELEKIDILLMTSDHEGLPMILLEAMASRVPIIAHAVGGIPNLLDHGNCGLLVKENNPDSYATAIFELAQHPEQRTRITQQAFKRLREHYSAEQNAANYLKAYQDIRL